MRVAQVSVRGRFLILTKVNLADVLRSPMADPVDQNRISQKRDVLPLAARHHP